MQKFAKKLSVLMVALMTIMTVASYMPAKAATVVPTVKFVGEPKLEYKVGERVTFNLNASNYGGRVQYRVVLWDDNTKSMKDLWNTADRYYAGWMPYGNETLPLGWVINQPGSYRITVYAKRAGLANSKTANPGANCDSYVAGPAFKVVAATATVESIATVADVTVNEGETAVLPTEVTLNLSDKTTKTAKVTWAAVDTTKVGKVAVEGTVEGTDKKATVNVEVKAVALAAEISATNRKEVVVKFNKVVDRLSAETKELYSVVKAITGFTADTITSAKLLDDNKTVVLTMSSTLDNQVKYKASVLGVKQAGVAYTQKDTEFTVLDAQAPKVDSIVALGKRAIKVTFSEPVVVNTGLAASNYFMIDGKVASGTLVQSGREVTIKLFTDIAAGVHKLTVDKTVVDYNGYQALIETKEFEVAADTVAPTIKEVKNVTFEGAVLVFDEDVDPSTVKASNIFWKDGEIKRLADSATKIASGTYQLVFSGVKKLPVYETNLYVTGVKDYTGNSIAADASVKVKAIIDEVRPEVVSELFETTTAKKLTIKFNKTIDYTSFKATNFVIKDSDGKVVPNVYTIPATDSKDLVVSFANALDKGEYTFSLVGVKDTTTLANTMLPYAGTIKVVSITAPTVTSTFSGRTIILNFSQVMDLASTYSVLNTDNYWATYKVGTTTVTGKLPEQTSFEVLSTQKTVLITIPQGVTLVSLTVQGVKSADGMVLSGFAKEVYTTADNTFKYLAAKASSNSSVVVKFNQPVIETLPTDFRVSNLAGDVLLTPARATISSTDNTQVTLSWDTAVIPSDLTATTRLKVTIVGTNTKSIAGVPVALVNYAGSTNIIDNVAPSIVLNGDDAIQIKSAAVNDLTYGVVFDRATNKILVNFTEALTTANQDVAGTLFEIKNSYGTKLVYGTDYTMTLAGKLATITLIPAGTNVAGYDGVYFIKLNNASKYITDNNADADWNAAGTTLIKALADFDTETESASYAESIKLALDYAKPEASITNATYNKTSGVLVINGTFDNTATLDVTKVSLHGVALTVASATGATVAADKVTITVAGADLAAINAAPFDTTGDKVDAISIAAALLTDAAANTSVLEAATGNTVTVSN